jgi:hypothetical protein
VLTSISGYIFKKEALGKADVFAAIAMKISVYLYVMPWALVRTDVPEKHIAAIRKVERINKLGLRVTANVAPISLILSILVMEAIRSSEASVLTRFTWLRIPEDNILQRSIPSN